MTARRIVAVSVLSVCALGLAGCSQVAAIAPVGGDHLAEVRFAAIDVLVAAGTELLSAPDCTTEPDGAISCIGETVDGQAITVLSPAEDPTVVTVSLGAAELYSGSIQDVLEKAQRPTG